MSYERFMRTAQWVLLTAPVVVKGAPVVVPERGAEAMDPEILWRRFVEERQATTTMPLTPNQTQTAEQAEKESMSGKDGEDSNSLSGSLPGEESSASEEGSSLGSDEGGIKWTTRRSRTAAPTGTLGPPNPPTPSAITSSIEPSKTALGDTQTSGTVLATAKPQMGNTADHTRMELGVSAGVIAAFILLGFLIFYYLKKKGKMGVLEVFKRPFRSSRSRSALESPSIQHQPAISPIVSVPEPVLLPIENRVSDVPSMTQISRLNSLQRKYTISRMMPEKDNAPAPGHRRGSSASSHRSVRSIASNGLPRGPKLPVIPSVNYNNPFGDDKQDPFADPKPDDFPAVPSSMRFAVKNGAVENIQKPTAPLNSPNEVLTLTDPRVSDSRRLTIANRSVRDSVPSPLPIFSNKKENNIPQPLRVDRRSFLPTQSRFSWSTKMGTDTPGFSKLRRESAISAASTDGVPKHRGVNSWVNHQTDRIERHPVEDSIDSPRYAKTEKELYDRRSLNSGMDTRRTEYEYDSDC